MGPGYSEIFRQAMVRNPTFLFTRRDHMQPTTTADHDLDPKMTRIHAILTQVPLSTSMSGKVIVRRAHPNSLEHAPLNFFLFGCPSLPSAERPEWLSEAVRTLLEPKDESKISVKPLVSPGLS